MVVSATGVWADELRRLDEGAQPDSIRPAKGVHVTIPWRLVGNDIAVIISVPGDKRSLFIVPWGELPDGTFEHCYVGTTDTDFAGALDDPQTDDADLEYVLRALNHALTTDDHPRRRDRRVGRAAAARRRAPTRRAPPTCRGVTASAPATPASSPSPAAS